MLKEYGDEWEAMNELDGNVIYRTLGGLKHGSFAMGNGSLKKAEVLAAVKKKRARSSSSSSYQAMQHQNEELQHEIAQLRERDVRREEMMKQQQALLKV